MTSKVFGVMLLIRLPVRIRHESFDMTARCPGGFPLHSYTRSAALARSSDTHTVCVKFLLFTIPRKVESSRERATERVRESSSSELFRPKERKSFWSREILVRVCVCVLTVRRVGALYNFIIRCSCCLGVTAK
jgi:hypothetical protein